MIWYPAETDVSIRPGWFYHAKEDSAVRSPAGLMDLYFSSVGRNSVLLLKYSAGSGGVVDQRSGCAEFAGVEEEDGGDVWVDEAAGAVKGVRWPAVGDRYAGMTIELELAGEKRFDVLELQENIRVGQRVERFVFEVMDGGNEGGRIGNDDRV